MPERTKSIQTTKRGEGSSQGQTSSQISDSTRTTLARKQTGKNTSTTNAPEKTSTTTAEASSSTETRPEIRRQTIAKPGGLSVQTATEDFGFVLTFTVPVSGGLGARSGNPGC